MNDVLLFVLQWLHVFLAVWWFGSIIVTRVTLWPALRRLGPETDQDVRRAMGQVEPRWIHWATTIGTVALGIIRGAYAGALGRLDEPYGITYLAAGALGIAMISWLHLPLPPGFYTLTMRRIYVACFPTMFTLMILMRMGL